MSDGEAMSDTPAETEELLARLRAGDQQALAELYSGQRERLRRMVALRLDRRLGGRVSPSDVLQEAYIDAVKLLDHYFAKPDLPFLGWLRLVVAQRLLQIHRQHLGAGMRNVALEIPGGRGAWPAASSLCLAERLAGDLTTPSEAAGRNEARARLEAAFEQMDPLDREILTLRHFEELSNGEVAEILGIQKAAASKRYVRALTRLKAALADATKDNPDRA
jgi:RNA polymerase sigma-70 factor (ECF subfamily)